jgi:PST family polysaccharide transporter
LQPSDFGVIAIATVVMTFFNLLTDVGISSAVVQKKELTENDFNHIFSFTVYMGILLCALFFIASWPISSFYDNEDISSICKWMSLLLFLSCAKIVPFGLLMRNKEFKYQSFVVLSASIIGGVLACIAAYWGMGAYSLLFSFITTGILTFIFFYIKYPVHFYWHPDINPLKHIFSYSAYVFLFNFVNYFSRDSDKLLIGRYIGMADLGQYQKSYALMMMPAQNISDVITPVLHPIFSEFQNNIHFIKEKYFKFLHIVSYISFTLCVFLYFVSSEAILIVYGDNWTPAIRPFQILSLTISTQMLLSSSGSIFQAVNATKQFFIAGCLCALYMLTAFVISIYFWGTIEAVAWGFLVAQLLNTFSSFSILFRSLKASWGDFIPIIIRPLSFGVIIAIAFIFLPNFQEYGLFYYKSDRVCSFVINTNGVILRI